MLRRINLKTQQSPVVLDLCLTKTGAGKKQDYRKHTKMQTEAGVFKFVRFKERFRDGFVSTEGLTGEIKLLFQISQL